MATQWFTTLDEDRAQFGDYRVNPEKATERILTRVWYGISKVAFPTLRATIDATTEITNPKVDNQTYQGTWRIKDMRTQEGTGEFAGSLTVLQDIANELNDGPGLKNEYLAGLQSDVYELSEYAWMKYTHTLKRTTKKWTNLTQTGAEDAFAYLSELVSPEPSGAWYELSVRTGYSDYLGGAIPTAKMTGTWGSKYWNMVYWDAVASAWKIVDGLRYYNPTTERWRVSAIYSDGTADFTDQLTATEISQPHIESVRMQEEQDRSFTLYRTLSETTYPAVMRTIYYQYAGLILVAALPVEDATTISLSGFLNQTEKIYANARFRIAGDTYRVTADATCVAGAVSVTVTPPITAATVTAYGDYDRMVFFNAIG